MDSKISKLLFVGGGLTTLVGTLPFYLIGVPTIYFPMPVYMVVLAMAHTSWIASLAIFALSWTFFFNKEPKIFKIRALILNSVLTICSILWFIVSKNYAIKYQGFGYYLICIILNFSIISILWWCWISPSIRKNHLYTILMPVFLVGFAMPYLGELP